MKVSSLSSSRLLARSLGVGNVAEKETVNQRCFLYLDPFNLDPTCLK